MQTEQQITQTKKSSTSKKEKKTVSKKSSELQEQVIETSIQQNNIPEQVIEQIPEVQQEVVSNIIQDNQVSDNEIVITQEQDFNSILEFLNATSDKFTEYSKYFKDNIINKDTRNKYEASKKKFDKAITLFENNYYDALTRQLSSLEKNAGNKLNKVNKVTDKSKSAIHKELPVHDFLLKFMKLAPGTNVSRSSALTAITTYVKDEKTKNPDIIVDNDKRSFKIIGDLKTLFEGIEKVMQKKSVDGPVVMPSQIKYTQIMQYMTHCFVKDGDVVV